ncbi:oxidoreductase, zinc-binding protein [Hyaloraphidium curvatum]|nr:oxidoreductase, zinc-binding protein [Hyaloraphidium curvatum]
MASSDSSGSASLPNTRVYYVEIPKGNPGPSTFDVRRETIDTTKPLPEESLLLENLYLSVDPYMRLRMRSAEAKSYFVPFELNTVLQGGGVSRVLQSSSPSFKAGDVVQGSIGWEEYTIAPAAGFRKVEEIPGVPLSYYLGALGMPSETAYVGLLRLRELAPPAEGETVFISGAAGAVGQICGQIAKRRGCRVVGSAGSDEKIDFILKECGYDAAFNYKNPPGGSIEAALAQLCPNGIDFYFENVGGETLEAAMEVLNNHGRISVCGLISQYDDVYSSEGPAWRGPKNFHRVLTKRLAIKGFIVSDHRKECGADFARDMTQWIRNGEIKYREDIRWGIDKAGDTFADLLRGGNQGKMIVGIKKP